MAVDLYLTLMKSCAARFHVGQLVWYAPRLGTNYSVPYRVESIDDDGLLYVSNPQLHGWTAVPPQYLIPDTGAGCP